MRFSIRDLLWLSVVVLVSRIAGDDLVRFQRRGQETNEQIVYADRALATTADRFDRGSQRHNAGRLSGLQRDRFQIVDGELLSWHGSRTPGGIDYAEQVIVHAR